MRTKRSIKDSLKEYLNWCVGRLLLGGSRDDTVRDMVDAISDEIASGGGGVSQDQLDQTVKDITKSYGIADQTVLTSAESYTDQKIADVVDGSPEALDTLYELAKALGDDSNFATTVMDQIGQKLPTTTFENFIDNKAWTKDNLTKLSQLINNINSIKAGTRVESMDVNLASISSYLEYDLFDNNTTGTKPPGLTTGFLLTFSWDNGGWGAQIATSDGNVDGAIFLRTIKASESDKIWGPWVSLYNTANFNPDSKLNYNGFNGDLNTISTSGLYRLVSGCTNIPLGSSQGCFLLHTNWDANAAQQMYFVYSTTDIYIRNKVGGTWNPWQKVWNAGNFDPDNKFWFSAAQLSDLNNAPNNAFFVGAYNAANAPVAGSWSNGFTISYGNNPDFRKQFVYAGDKWWTRGRDGVNWGTWRQIWDSGNFNPENYLPLSGGSITGGLGVSGYLTAGVLRVKATSYPQISFVNTTTNRDSLLFVNGSELYWRPTAGTATDYQVYHSGNFNPDNYLNAKKGLISDLNTATGSGVYYFSTPGSVNTPENYGSLLVVATVDNGSPWINQFAFGTSNKIWHRQNINNAGWNSWTYLYDSSNLGNATTSKAGLMSAADKTKLDGLSGGGLNIPAYIFPGDPSKLDSLASSTHITSILGTAIDLLDAFNNGRVFISKTVTFNEVQVPSDITYSLLKSIDPDNPTIFQIIMSTVVRGHYIEITIDFENNEYQAISNTINGIIGVNNTGTTN